MITSEIGHTTPTEITVRGVDLATDIIGHMDFVEVMVLAALARRPTAGEKAVINALLIMALDHGLTPSSIAARLTFAGAPESFAGAVAAGLLGAGSRYLGPSVLVARQFGDWLGDLPDDSPQAAFDRLAAQIVENRKTGGKRLPGFGHPIHKDGDPRVSALRRVVRDNGFYGKGWKLADALEARFRDATPPLPMNAAGSVGATILDLGLAPEFAIAITLVGRCAGLAAHVIEEGQSPIGSKAWELIATQDPRVDFGRS